MAAPQTPPDPVEGVEALLSAETQPGGAWYPAAKGPQMGWQQQGVLAHRGLAASPACPSQRLLGGPRPAQLHPQLHPSAGHLVNRRMRTRMSGGVGGGG